MMLRSTTLATVVALATALAGCPDNSTNPDAASPGTDAFSALDTGGASPDAFEETTTDAGGGATDDAAMMAMDDAASGSPTWGDVHTRLAANCGPCHVSGRSGGHSMGQADVMAAYSDSQMSATACAGLTKGACAAMRVRAGTMPPGGLAEPLRSEVASVLEGWVAAGQPAP